jgi:hypothetical protein
MHRHETPTGTARMALQDTLIGMPLSIAPIVAGFELVDRPNPLPAVAMIGIGGLFALISGKRWQDYHELKGDN